MIHIHASSQRLLLNTELICVKWMFPVFPLFLIISCHLKPQADPSADNNSVASIQSVGLQRLFDARQRFVCLRDRHQKRRREDIKRGFCKSLTRCRHLAYLSISHGFGNNGEFIQLAWRDDFIGERKWPIKDVTIRPGTFPQEALIKTQLSLSVEAESPQSGLSVQLLSNHY